MSLPRTGRPPYASAVLILVNVAALIALPDSIQSLGLVPSHFRVWNLITYTLCHAGPGHLATNMALLAVFGSFVERRLWWPAWLAVYFGGAIAGGLGEVAMLALQPMLDQTPIIGASAGVTAIMGTAFTLAFRDLQPDVWTKLTRFVAPAWVIEEGIRGVWMAGAPGQTHTAVWAHVIGFLFGVLLASKWRPEPRSVEERARTLIAEGSPGDAISLLEGSEPSPTARDVATDRHRRARLELLERAWAALGDKEQAAKAQLQVVEMSATPEALELLQSFSGLGLLAPAKRMEITSARPPLPVPLLTAILETFVGEPTATPHRPAALLRLAELTRDSARARSLFELVAKDYPGTEAADRAAGRLRIPPPLAGGG